MSKTTFSRYCNSAFFGTDCKCKRCCSINKKTYNEKEELMYFIYAYVMTEKSFILEYSQLEKYLDKSHSKPFIDLFIKMEGNRQK